MTHGSETRKELARQSLDGALDGAPGRLGDWMEEIIANARRDGAFDNLSGKGKPLNLQDPDPYAGEDAMAYRLLKQAGFVPEWVELRKVIEEEVAWLRVNPTHEKREERRLATNRMIEKHNRLLPNLSLSLPKLPADFGLPGTPEAR